jgi:hypothetical protein
MVFARLAEGHASHCNYEINGHQYTTDIIYPIWSTCVKTICEPLGQKKSQFSWQQETWKKDVERPFDVLQAQFAIVKYPTLTWSQEETWEVINASEILHNMIIDR